MISTKCCKCGAENADIKFFEKSEKVGQGGRIDNEFIYSTNANYNFDHIAQKDFLYIGCKICGYKWKRDTLDFNTTSNKGDL